MAVCSVSRFASLCAVVLTGVLVAGCRQSPEPLAPVKGTVLYRGKPLPGGLVVFVPDAARGTHGGLAIAEIKPDGSYMLKTNDLVGATPGFYRITVAYNILDPSGSMAHSMLPAKYRDPEQSGLACEVHASKANTIEIELQ
jgi:hypothetical protein